MRIELWNCETCKKETKDFMKDAWIEVRGGFTKWGGRKKKGQAFSTTYIGDGPNKQTILFF